MIVALARITLHLPDNHSLKGKRKVIKSLIEKIRNRFEAAIAEGATLVRLGRAIFGER